MAAHRRTFPHIGWPVRGAVGWFFIFAFTPHIPAPFRTSPHIGWLVRGAVGSFCVMAFSPHIAAHSRTFLHILKDADLAGYRGT